MRGKPALSLIYSNELLKYGSDVSDGWDKISCSKPDAQEQEPVVLLSTVSILILSGKVCQTHQDFHPFLKLGVGCDAVFNTLGVST